MGLQNIPNALLIIAGVSSMAFSIQQEGKWMILAFIFLGMFLILGGFSLWDNSDVEVSGAEQ